MLSSKTQDQQAAVCKAHLKTGRIREEQASDAEMRNARGPRLVMTASVC